jgi:PAS domain S-box-containing protein
VKTESEIQSRDAFEALRESEERSRLAQMTTGVGIWEWDLLTDTIEWSENIYRLLGITQTADRLELSTWRQLVLAEDLEPAEQRMKNLLDAGASEFYDEFRIRRRDDGRLLWIATQGRVIRDGEKPTRLIGVNYDITERKESELKIKSLNAELKKRVGELQTIFDLSPVGIAVAHDAECKVITANAALAKMVGVDPGANISATDGPLPYLHLRAGRKLPPGELPMQRAVAERRTIVNDELEIRRADGSTITIYSYAAPVFDDNGEVVSCVAAQVDITERKRRELKRERDLGVEQALRKQAEEANRLKDEFLATVSHELRTPLNSIIGWITMIREHSLPEEMRERAVAAIDRGARSQSQLIEDLLDVSRIISGKLQLNIKPVDLNTAMSAALETLRPAADAKGVALRAYARSAPAIVLGDFNRVQQIIWNLLSNAVKFTPKGGSAEIRIASSDNSRVSIEVIDTGKGIEPEFLPFVFDRFRQADGSITRSFAGLGLGLAIVRHLVELHGGSVSVASEGADKGSTFTVSLPLMTAEVQETAISNGGPPALNPEHTVLRNARILVVDDDESTREILKLTFERYGSAVATADSADDAFNTVCTWIPQIVVSDIGMPQRDGYSFIDDVRRWETETCRGLTPAVALTAYARPEDRLKAIEAGFDAYVAKPVNPHELISLVASLLGSRPERKVAKN